MSAYDFLAQPVVHLVVGMGEYSMQTPVDRITAHVSHVRRFADDLRICRVPTVWTFQSEPALSKRLADTKNSVLTPIPSPSILAPSPGKPLNREKAILNGPPELLLHDDEKIWAVPSHSALSDQVFIDELYQGKTKHVLISGVNTGGDVTATAMHSLVHFKTTVAVDMLVLRGENAPQRRRFNLHLARVGVEAKDSRAILDDLYRPSGPIGHALRVPKL